MFEDMNDCNCEGLERAFDREIQQYEKELAVLNAKLAESNAERALLLEQVKQLRFRIEGLEK